jgi:hypothetical protein
VSLLKNYTDLYESLVIFKEKLEELLSVLPESKEVYKKKISLQKSWDKSQALVHDLGVYIVPVESLPVIFPEAYDNVDFINTWSLYKEYLQEQHGISMHSRMEIKSLKLLVEISESDPERAIRYLEYAIAKGFKGFFRVDDNAKPTEKLYDPDFNKKSY